jgi:hypothetical protein
LLALLNAGYLIFMPGWKEIVLIYDKDQVLKYAMEVLAGGRMPSGAMLGAIADVRCDADVKCDVG